MASFTLDPAKTALVVIDLTKGVLSLSSEPYLVQQVLAKTVRLAEAFRRSGSFQELIIRHRARKMLILCLAALQVQWWD